MKITPVSNYQNQFLLNQNSNCNTSKSRNIVLQNNIQNKNIHFTGRMYKILGIDPIWHFHNYSIDEYFKLTKSELIKLRRDYASLKAKNPQRFDKLEKIHEGIADYMQKTLDKQFGRGNYTVISIGRSMSSITKLLGYKIGENNVINIPMTNAAKFLDSNKVDALAYKKELKLFMNYLNSIGLSEDKIKNLGKNYIITDFCCTGSSLSGAENLFKSKLVWNNPQNVSTIDFISDWAANNYISIINDFMRGEYKKYSFVNRCCKLSDCANKIKNTAIATRQIKLVWFNLLDKEMQKQSKKGVIYFS
jgi:hypothetical protein